MRIAVIFLVVGSALLAHAVAGLAEPRPLSLASPRIAQLSPQLPSAPTLTPSLTVPNHPTVQDPIAAIPAQPATSAPTVCTEQYAPVCGRVGTDLRTYSNACFARAAGAVVVAAGPCADGSASPR